MNFLGFCKAVRSNASWFKKQIQMKVHQYICEGTSFSNAVVKTTMPPSNDASTQAMHDVMSDGSEYSLEMDKLKKEVERLLFENSALRKEIARLQGKEPPDAGEAGLCILSCSVDRRTNGYVFIKR